MTFVAAVANLPRWIGRFIPSVKYVQDHSPVIEEFHQRPLDNVMRNVVSVTLTTIQHVANEPQKNGTAKPSLMARLIEARDNSDGEEEEAIKNFTDADLKGAGGVLYSAGQDTTFSSETVFVLGMLLAPDVQARAQKEIDAVTGGKRLPDYGDWKALPIVERIAYEALRYVKTVSLSI